MSRIIVKNLPNNITSEKVKEQFSQFGRVTDIQLKYTPEGKFRKFGFVGFETNDEAAEAIARLNKTYIGTSRIDVQLCAKLGDSTKPKSWSKYAADSSAFQKLHGNKIDSMVAQLSKNSKKKKKQSMNSEAIEALRKYMDNPEFLEFLKLRGKKDFVLKILEESSKDEENEDPQEENIKEEDPQNEENKSVAFADISDAEYMKLKGKGKSKPILDSDNKIEEQEKVQLYSVKISNLPYKAKKKDVKEMLNPIVPASIRFMKNGKGVAYVGFKSEKEMRRALVKNKTFLSGKQLLITEVIDKEKTGKPNKWKEQEESLKNEECVAESGRIFIRNLPYSATEEEIKNLFSTYGPVAEVVLPFDKFQRMIRGYGIVTFLMPEHAVTAFAALDGTVFHGRMLHLLPGKSKEEESDADATGSYKVMKEKKKKATAGSSYNWNTLFLDLNAVADVIAEKYSCTREEVLTGKNAAVQLALGETQIVASTKQFLESNGVALDAFNQESNAPRSKTVILVKNLPAKTTVSEIRERFEKHGILGRVLLPPSGTTAIVEFLEPAEAREAYRHQAYSKFKNLILYLEWAPNNTFKSEAKKEDINDDEQNEDSPVKEEDKEDNKEEDKSTNGVKAESESDEDEFDLEPDTTIFVKNMNFETKEEALKKHFEPCGKVAKVQVARKRDAKAPGGLLSMGYGFVQFYQQSAANEALKKLQGSMLEGHTVELKRSNKTLVTEAVNTRKKTNMSKQTGSKILVRNIPFQATAKEIESLFLTFGSLKFVRLPQKLAGTGPHRGFGFVEFLSKKDAKHAMKALGQSTHLFGRRLVLEWAKVDDGVNELRKRTAERFQGDIQENKRPKATFSMDDNTGQEEMDEDDEA